MGESMKFSCDSKAFAYALNKCASLTKKSTTYPAIRNLLIEVTEDTIYVSATDVSTYVTYAVEPISITSQGKALVDARTLSAFVSAKASKIDAYLTDANKFMVKSGGLKISLNQSATELPGKPVLPNDALATISGKSLKDVLAISFMAEQDDLSKALSGTMIIFDNSYLYSLAASSGRFGYAWSPIKYDGKAKFLLPPSATRLLPYYLYDDDAVDLYISNNKMFCVTKRFTMSCSQIAGRFPDKHIVDAANAPMLSYADIPAAELGNALEMAIVMSEGTDERKYQRVLFDFDFDYSLLNLSTARENEIGELDWPVAIRKHDGENFSFWLYSGFISDILKAVKKVSDKNLFADLIGEQVIRLGKGKSVVDGGTDLAYFTSTDINAIFGVAPMIAG